MTNEEAIKFLKQLYPHGGCSWLDEQRIEAISIAIKAIETKMEDEKLSTLERNRKKWKDINEDFEAEWKEYFKYKGEVASVNIKDLARHFVEWQRKQDEKEYGEFLTKGLVSAKGINVKMAYEQGKYDMKEEMMKNAIEGTISEIQVGRSGSHLELNAWVEDNLGLKDGDEVNVVILKEN